MFDLTTIISVVAVVFSGISLIFTLVRNSALGEVGPVEPSAYGVVRGVDRVQGIGPHPSDHLLLPIEWKNASGRTAIVKQPRLTLQKLSKEGKKVGTEIVFTLAGEYPDVSTESFQERYSHKSAILIEPRSVTTNTLVFHIEDFWIENGGRYFRFAPYNRYKVNVTYVKYSGLSKPLSWLFSSYADGEKTENLLEELTIHGSVQDLKLNGTGEPWWDYWNDVTFDLTDLQDC